ncbi:MAG TPA: hypothetical protein VMB79_18255 [Jatrophihabitans sp.]|nr:hypothetical protein [Jatrophihabitans sp.]
MTTPDTQAGPVAAAADPAPAVNHVQLAALSAVLAGVLAAGSYTGTVSMLVAVAVLQAVLVPCWVLGHRLPGRIGGLVIGGLAAAAADGLTLHWPDSGYSPVLGVLGVAIPALFLHQLTRGVVRTRVVESLAGLALLLVAVVAPAGLIVLRHEADGRTVTLSLVAAFGVGLVAAHLMDAVLPSPRFDPAVDRGLPAVVVGVIAGGALGYLGLRDLIDFAGGRGIFAGAAVAAVGCLLSIAASFADARTGEPVAAGNAGPGRLDRLRPAAAVAIAIALTVPAGYVLSTALTS